MEKYNLTDLDYLFIDTEGLDTYIINSIDFETDTILKNMEKNLTDKKTAIKESALTLMKDLNYQMLSTRANPIQIPGLADNLEYKNLV
jgi:hypothetical protein